eukprot:scaffold25246_cov26-Cyclotella_meneghiniana.AAC.1
MYILLHIHRSIGHRAGEERHQRRSAISGARFLVPKKEEIPEWRHIYVTIKSRMTTTDNIHR